MPDPTLKLIVAWSGQRNLCSLVRDSLSEVAPASEQRTLGDDAVVVCTTLTAAAVRDRLRPLLHPGEGLLVAEFEVWSGYGKALDAAWLLARGH